jgi:hypothetical protein
MIGQRYPCKCGAHSFPCCPVCNRSDFCKHGLLFVHKVIDGVLCDFVELCGNPTCVPVPGGAGGGIEGTGGGAASGVPVGGAGGGIEGIGGGAASGGGTRATEAKAEVTDASETKE